MSVSCPVCGHKVYIPLKRWLLKPKNKNGRALLVEFYECPNPECMFFRSEGRRKRWRVVRKAALP